MRLPALVPLLAFALALPVAAAQAPKSAQPNPNAAASSQAPASAPKAAPPQQEQQPHSSTSQNTPDPNAELRKAVQDAGNDRAALVHNLKDYLRRFPDTPAKASIYRALVESEVRLHDDKAALVYAERLIALEPGDAEMMLYAIRLLKEQGDPDGLKRAVDYAGRVIDRVETAPPGMKPKDMSQQDWDASRKRLEMAVYLIRGQLQIELKDNDAAAADLNKSFSLIPNPEAALYLGEVAELRHQPDQAIGYYAEAFVLPDQQGSMVDRAELRRKLGNLWVLQHGSESGMGERILKAYDEIDARGKKASPPPVRNAGVTDLFAFTLRRPDGSAPYRLSDAKGKIVVLEFWATWCTPCLQMEPLFEQLRDQYASRPDIVFLAVNDDIEESHVAPFLKRKQMGSTVVFSDGLDRLLGVRTLPAVLVLDRTGKVAYRATGFDPATFTPKLKDAIDRTLSGAK